MAKRRRHVWRFSAFGGGWAAYSCTRLGCPVQLRTPSLIGGRLDRWRDDCNGTIET